MIIFQALRFCVVLIEMLETSSFKQLRQQGVYRIHSLLEEVSRRKRKMFHLKVLLTLTKEYVDASIFRAKQEDYFDDTILSVCQW